MNALLLLFLTLCICLAGCMHRTVQAANLVKIESVDNDTNLKVTYTAYKKNSGQETKQGAYVMWYENGQKYIEANYDCGVLNGKCTIFTEEGKAEIEGVYRQGKPWDGEFQVAHEICKYTAGKLVGKRAE